MRFNTASVLALILSIFLTACGGGSGGGGASTPPTTPTGAWHTVTLSWVMNREKGVNSSGGGYTVSISGSSALAPINVPYVSGLAAPTSTIVSLYTGNYSVTVTAFAALDANGGSTSASSIPSTTISINVP